MIAPIPRPRITVSSKHLQRVKQRFVLGISFISILGCAIGFYQVIWGKVGYLEIGLLLLMVVLTGIGITVGFHRFFSHKTFKTKRSFQVILAILGSMAGNGTIIAWVSVHRCHHQYSDRSGDPHSPHIHGEVTHTGIKGLWHAHIGWLLNDEIPNSMIFAKDLLKDPVICKINQLYPVWIFLGLAIPAILGGLISGTWEGVFQGFLWGGLVRLFISFNSGYLINSMAHVYGTEKFSTIDRSKNNVYLAILTMGEGWHNNHHAFSNSAKFGLQPWEIDLGYWVIYLLNLLGLVWEVQTPTIEAIEAKKLSKN